MSHALQLTRVSDHIGADVEEIDLGKAIDRQDRDVFDAMQRAIDEHIVLPFRRQTLSPEQMESLGRHFGPLLSLKRPMGDAVHIEGIEFPKVISNVQNPDGTTAGDGSNAAQDWHTDGAAKPVSAGNIYFYARAVPDVPPRTYWMNAYLIYDSLPAETKETIADLKVIHHEYPAGNEFPLPPSKPLEQRLIGPQHPLVRRHPRNGRPILFLPHRYDMLVAGWNETDSFALISSLRAQAASSPIGGARPWKSTTSWYGTIVRPCTDGWENAGDRIIRHLANVGEPPIPLR